MDDDTDQKGIDYINNRMGEPLCLLRMLTNEPGTRGAQRNQSDFPMEYVQNLV